MDVPALDLNTVYRVAEWMVRIGALGVVPMRRSPASARAWLLLIFLLPLPGLALFLIIGSPRFPKWRRDRFNKLTLFFAGAAHQLQASSPDLGQANAIAAFASSLGGMPATGGNAIELIDDYDGLIARLVADIDEARHDVHLLVYIYADDSVGVRVADALGRAAARGVRCRVMFDPVGSIGWLRGTLRILRRAGVEVRVSLPFRLLRRVTRRDMRNHRKLFVIDGRIGYAGSQNIVSKGCRPGVINRELVARVTGPVVTSMDAVVRGDWSLESGIPPGQIPPSPRPTGTAQAQLLPSGADYPLEGFETLLVWQLHQAREYVIIVTPYFVPDDNVLSAMRTAAARGVTVDLIVSRVVDQRLVSLAQSSYLDDLLTAGVRVFFFRDFLLHAKNVCIDGYLAVIGSSNVDLRSFQLNEEVSLLLYDAASVANLERMQRSYMAASDRVSLDTWRKRPLALKLLENIARLVSSVL